VHDHCAQNPASDDSGLARYALELFNFGWVGVPIFFVISGFCIAATADRTRRGKTTMRSYFARRFLRIFPPYWIVVLLCAIIVALTDIWLRPWWFSPSQWFGNLTLTETWRHHLFGSPFGLFVGQAWTLCYEEQFYLVVGLLLMLAPRYMFVGAALISLGCVGSNLAMSRWDLPIAGFFFDGSWLMFGAGMLAYYHLNYLASAYRPLTYCTLSAALAMSLCGYFQTPKGGVPWAFGFCLALLLLHRWDVTIAKSRWARPATICGTMCYSLYLVHMILTSLVQVHLYNAGIASAVGILFITVPVCLAISLMAGWGVYIAVERHFVGTSQRDSQRRSIDLTLGETVPMTVHH
jgi:peptidoglycan/LPS O-acetylase OafA/YrhL